MRKFAFFFLLSLFFSQVQSQKFSNGSDEICPLLVGSTLPESMLRDVQGNELSSGQIFTDKPTVLIFYRGSWCPYCSKHMSAIAKLEPELLEMGFQIIGVTPDSPEKIEKFEDKKKLNYTVYSDSKMEFADAMGLGFTLDEKTLKNYKTWGINLEKASGGETHHRLPVPAVYILNQEGVVTFSYVNPNYKVRASEELIQAAAQTAL